MTHEKLHILLGESSHYHAVVISRQLSAHFENISIDLFTAANQLIKAAESEAYDMIIVDPDMNSAEHLDLLPLLSKLEKRPPIVLLMTRASELQLPSEKIRLAAAVLIKENLYFQALPSIVCDLMRRKTLIDRNRELDERMRHKEQKQLVKIAASTLSHEINNPLQTILGTAELMSESIAAGNPEIAAKIGIIQESAARIQRTLHRLANLATPAINQTASGDMIDPERSRIYTRRKHPVTNGTE